MGLLCSKILGDKYRPFLASVQRLDAKLSAPIQNLQLGCLDYLLAFPDGEAGCGPKGFFTFLMPLFLMLHFVWEPIFPAFFVTMLVGIGPVGILKVATSRLRPPAENSPPRMVNVRKCAHRELESFPSGCSCWSGIISVLMYDWTGNPGWFLLTALSMFVRIYFHCHWFGDTFLGALVGVVSTFGLRGEGFRRLTFESPLFYMSIPLLPVTVFMIKIYKGKPCATTHEIEQGEVLETNKDLYEDPENQIAVARSPVDDTKADRYEDTASMKGAEDRLSLADQL